MAPLIVMHQVKEDMILPEDVCEILGSIDCPDTKKKIMGYWYMHSATRRVDRRANIYVAYLGNIPMGVAIVVDRGHKVILDLLVVKKEARGSGVGSSLINRIIDDSMPPVYLEVHVDNIRARQLYLRFGFRSVDCRCDFIVMRLRGKSS